MRFSLSFLPPRQKSSAHRVPSPTKNNPNSYLQKRIGHSSSLIHSRKINSEPVIAYRVHNL